jgi:acyl-CoA synthetase (AMP-forming)/AMP-acid ligase II
VPVTIAVVDALPRTPSQKVDLAATREWFTARGATNQATSTSSSIDSSK